MGPGAPARAFDEGPAHCLGGGVYYLGMFTFDVFTVIKGNHASTSNNDIYP